MTIVTPGKREAFTNFLRNFSKTCTCMRCGTVFDIRAEDLDFYFPNDSDCKPRVNCPECDLLITVETSQKMIDFSLIFRDVMSAILADVADLGELGDLRGGNLCDADESPDMRIGDS